VPQTSDPRVDASVARSSRRDRQRSESVDQHWRRRLKQRLRAEFVAGAEGEWRKPEGRPMKDEELERVLRRFRAI
jgi:hypothetical protein